MKPWLESHLLLTDWPLPPAPCPLSPPAHLHALSPPAHPAGECEKNQQFMRGDAFTLGNCRAACGDCEACQDDDIGEGGLVAWCGVMWCALGGAVRWVQCGGVRRWCGVVWCGMVGVLIYRQRLVRGVECNVNSLCLSALGHVLRQLASRMHLP